MRIAILIPCFNEASTVGRVIDEFRNQLPDARIYVFDNNSSDDTYAVAQAHGAIVKREPNQGKGRVVRAMFRAIDADVYVLVDGDDTYPADQVHRLIQPVIQGEADMIVGDRLSGGSYALVSPRAFHSLGNEIVRRLINTLFQTSRGDIMSGYRSLSRAFVKNVTILSSGFELETELTLQALEKRFTVAEIPVSYRQRPPGSTSKLSTFKDGFRVIRTILWVFKDYRPLPFFAILSLFLLLSGLAVGFPVVTEYLRTGFISRVPSAILATGLILLSGISATSGIILDTIVKHNREIYELIVNRYFQEEN